MSKFNFGVLACKILGLYSLIQAISFIQIAALQIATSGVATNVGISKIFVNTVAFVPIVLFLVLAVALWFLSDVISHRMVDGLEESKEVTQKITSKDIEIVGFTLFGLFICVQAIPHLTEAISSYYQIPKELRLHSPVEVTAKIRLISAGIQFMIGLFLVFGSKGAVGVLRRLREAGCKEGRNERKD
jgi:quinol-cytochrome oxidoreductase complex cytochrome b subunit